MMTQHAEIVNVLSNHSAQLYSITKYGYPKQYKIHKISCTLCKNVPKCNPVPNPIYNKWSHKLSMTTIRSSLHLRYLFLLSFTLNHRLPGYFYQPVGDCQFQTSPLHFLELKKVVGTCEDSQSCQEDPHHLLEFEGTGFLFLFWAFLLFDCNKYEIVAPGRRFYTKWMM